jgi:hypothetical protein
VDDEGSTAEPDRTGAASDPGPVAVDDGEKESSQVIDDALTRCEDLFSLERPKKEKICVCTCTHGPKETRCIDAFKEDEIKNVQ